MTGARFGSTFENLKLTHRLGILVATFVLGFALAGGCGLVTLNELKVNGPIYQRIVQGKDLVADILPPPLYIIESYLVVLQAAATKDSKDLDAFAKRLEHLRKDYLARREHWVKESLEPSLHKPLVDESYAPAARFFEIAQSQLLPALKDGNRAVAARQLDELESLYMRHRTVIDKLVDAANKRNEDSERQAAESVRARLTFMMVLFLVSMGAGVALAIVTVRRIARSADSLCSSIASAARENDLTRQLAVGGGDEFGRIAESVATLMQTCRGAFQTVGGGSQAVTAAVAQVAHSAAKIEASSQAQSEASASTAAAVEELTVSINHIADSTRETRAATEQASKVSNAGRAAAQQASGEMQRIAQTVCDSAGLINQLSQRSADIGGIARVIKDIADQTNLLALNAAIEAARAGEQGRGFAVVADEVRKLAERTGGATAQINAMIESIQQEIATVVARLQTGSTQAKEGVKMSDKVAIALAEIEQDARNTLSRIAAVASAASEQGAVSNEIAQNVERIAQMTEQNMREVSETTAAVRHLQEAARQFEGEMARFKY